MKRAATPLLLAMILVGLSADRGWGAPGEKIRVLITTGGHGFEVQAFYTVFDAMPDVAYAKATLPEDGDLLKPGLERRYDVLLRYDMVAAISPQQQEAFVQLLEKGIGLVAMHHNLGAHPAWDEYRKIIGGKFLLEPATIDGKAYAKSPWQHDEDLAIEIADSRHPITQGMRDFRIHDETYGPFYTAPQIHVLLKTNHPRNNPVVAWTHKYANSPVFYLMLGHDGKAYGSPQFRELVQRGIRWAARR